ERGTEGGMLANQGNSASPGRQGVERLRQCHADHRADRVAGSAGPAGGRQLGCELGDLRAAEQRRNLFGVEPPCYLRPDHGGHISWSRPPEVAASRGSLFIPPLNSRFVV